MDLEQFKTLKEAHKDNAELTSALAKIESEAITLVGKKDTAVENEQKFRSTKQEIAKVFGVEENISTVDLIEKISKSVSGYKQKIESFENNSSSKELENANFKEQLSALTKQLGDISGQLNDERVTNKLNGTKDALRKELANNLIIDPNAQDMAINNVINSINDETNIPELAKTLAESNPFLANTIHKGGANTHTTNNNNNQTNNGLSDVKINDRQGRINSIQAQIDANPNRG